MEQKGLRTGHIVALVGAIAALASLWRPWYSIEVPQQFRDALGGQLGQDPGVMGEFARGLASALPQKIEASAWTELGGADVAVAIGAIGVAGLIVAAAGAFGSAVKVDPSAIGRAIAAVGAAGLVLALVHVVKRPFDGNVVKVADGLWIALAGCAAVTVGGLMAGAPAAPARSKSSTTSASAGGTGTGTAFPPLTDELPPVFAPTAAAAAGSVAPPGV
jgi:hypothetical protein